MSQNILNLHQEFLEYLEIERGRSLKTVENYDRYLKRFLKFSNIQIPSEITDEVIRKYRLYLNRENLNRKTQNYHLIAIRVFLKYCARRDIKSLAPERIELAKVSQRELDLVSENDLERLLKSPMEKSTGKYHKTEKLKKTALLASLRDRAIIELLFSTGLRVSELCSLNKDHVENAKTGEFSVKGKGGKIRVVFLSDSAKEAIKDYLAKRNDTSEALFIRIPRSAPQISDTNLRLTPRSIERIIRHHAISAGISKKVTPHVMRHLYATDLLQNGADLRSVQALLGHASITATQIYTHVTNKQLKEIHKKFHDQKRKTDK